MARKEIPGINVPCDQDSYSNRGRENRRGKKIWDIEGVVAHYKQNIILYLKKDTALYNTLQADSDFIYDVVHPETYLMHAMDAEHHKSKRLNIILQRFFRRLFAFLY